MTTIDPAIAHNQTILAAEEKFAGKSLYAPKPADAPAPIKADEATPAAPAPVDAPAPTPEAKPAAPNGDGGSPPVTANARLERSMAIQRRAQESMRRARAEAGKLRQPAKEPAKPEAPPAASQPQAQPDNRVAEMQAQLEAEIRLAKTDPLAFAKRHGVSGAQIADYIRTGADPNARAIDLLRQDTARAIEQVRNEVKAEYAQQIQGLQSQLIQDQETRAQTNFFTFVEEAKEQNPDAFKAIGSGLLYSEAELWNKANELLANREDLQKDFDEDKLLEAVEIEARKDPRWSRLEPLLQSQNQQKPNAAPKSEKSNASAKVEQPEAPKAPEQVQRTQPRERDPRTGQFVEQRRSPFEDHTQHVDKIVNRVLGRFGG